MSGESTTTAGHGMIRRWLAFGYQEEEASGEGSTFFKLVRHNGA